MKYYIKQKVFSLVDRFEVYDEFDEVVYTVEGEFFSFGKKYHIYNTDGYEIAYIHQKLLTFLPKFEVYVDETEVAEIVKDFSLFVPAYHIELLDWNIEGEFWAHDYKITSYGSIVATISKEWFTWGDKYWIDVEDEYDQVMVVATVLAIDACLETSASVSANNTN